jgi:hypothetical protein
MAFASAALAADPIPPKGTHKAEVFLLGSSAEVEAAAAKMKAALAKKSAWLQKYLKEKNPKPGEILPYHENFGVTEAEYKLIVESKKTLTLKKIGSAPIQVEDAGEGKLKITLGPVEGLPLALPVTEFTLSKDRSEMSCKFGSDAKAEEINQTDAKAPTGKWSGKQWSIEKGNADTAAHEDAWRVSLALGNDAENRRLMYLRAVGRVNGETMDASPIFRWAGE